MSYKHLGERMGEKIFEDVKVADFSWYAVGPAVTRAFAENGAEVVHVESGTRVDGHRTTPPFSDNERSVNRSGTFAMNNHAKYGMTLNLRHPKGVEVAKRLVAWADIVTESFTPGTFQRLGLGYEELKIIKPGIILFSTCQMGQTGPLARYPGFGTHLTSFTGFVSATGWPDRLPSLIWGPYTDFIGMHSGLLAMAAGIDYQRRTGIGQHIDLSQYESSVNFTSLALLEYQANGREYPRMGNRSPYTAPHGVYPCRGEERWCAIAVSSEAEWLSFCRVIGKPEWIKEPRFATLTARKRNEDELEQSIAECTQDFTAEELMMALQAAGVSAGVVKNPRDVAEDPQLKYRHYAWEVEHPEMGKHSLYETNAFRFSETPAEITKPAPCLGEHTYHVCTEILGMSSEEFAQLLSEGVFE
ncbi:CaiB/BaiF CoA transferase family protein [Chloroflexota bacterium]